MAVYNTPLDIIKRAIDSVLNQTFQDFELFIISNQVKLIEDKKVIIIDDVLYSGRSVRAALTAIQYFGRPLNIELLVLIDRRFSRHLPIQPDYRGRQVDVIDDEKVKVCWKEKDGEDAVYLI